MVRAHNLKRALRIHTRRCCSVCVVLLALAASIVNGFADDFAAVLNDVRHAERLVRAGLKTADVDELRVQHGKLEQIGERIIALTRPGDLRRISCGVGAATLANVAADIRLPPARRVVAVEDDFKEYRRYMADCERAVRAGESARQGRR